MGSSRVAEQRVELTRINAPGVDDVRDAGKQGAGTSLAGEKQVNPGDVAAPNPSGVQQDSVFGDIEEDLKKHDERERLLAEGHRVLEKEREEAQRKKRGTARRKPDGTTTLESASTNDVDSCYIQIKNLVLIENSVIHKKALEEWDRREKLFASRVERKSTKVESRKNEVYNLIGFFSVFQGVVLTAVSQANLLHCNNLWSPILLSVLASIVTIAGVLQKLMQISALEETIFSENEALKDAVHRGQALRREGKDFVFAQFSECRKKKSKKGYSTWYGLCVVGLLIVFTVAFPLSHWRILCYPGRNPYC